MYSALAGACKKSIARRGEKWKKLDEIRKIKEENHHERYKVNINGIRQEKN